MMMRMKMMTIMMEIWQTKMKKKMASKETSWAAKKKMELWAAKKALNHLSHLMAIWMTLMMKTTRWLEF